MEFFHRNKYNLELADKIKKKTILEFKFYFLSTFRKITVGGFVNQVIKKFLPKLTCTGSTHQKANSFHRSDFVAVADSESN